MIRVRMVSDLVGENGRDWLVGEIHEATPHFARHLFYRGAAVLADEGQPPSLPAGPLTTAAIRNADPVPVNREPPRRKK